MGIYIKSATLFFTLISIHTSNSILALKDDKSIYAETESHFTLIIKLLQERFPKCSQVITYTDPEEKVHEEFYVSAINHLLERNLEADSILVKLAQQSLSESVPNGFNETGMTLDQIQDVHQHRPKCTLAIFMIYDKVKKNSVNYIFTQSSKWTGFLSKDEDFYLFLTNHEETTEDVLLTSSFALGVKYKILIEFPMTPSGNMMVKTTCFYCNDGHPQLITFPGLETLQRKFTRPNAVESNVPPIQGRFITMDKLFPDFGKNFHNRKLKVSSPSTGRWLIEIKEVNGIWETKRGIFNAVMNQLIIKYNFTIEVHQSTGGGGTGALKNKSWVGTVGDVLSGFADLGQCTGQLWARNKVVGFTDSISYQKLTFTSGIPVPYFTWRSLFWPLSSSVWIYLAIAYFLSIGFFHLFIKFGEENNTITISETASYLTGSLLEQDIPFVEKLSGKPVRIFLSLWLFSTLVITTAYRSKLISFLAFPNREKLPDSFEALANSNFEYALQFISGAAYAILKTSPNPTYQKIFKNMLLEPDDVKCFQRAIGKRFVCISWKGTAEFIFRRNLTGPGGQLPLVMSSDTTCFIAVGIIFQKGAIFRKDFNQLISTAHTSGLMIKWNEIDLDFVQEERKVWERGAKGSRNDTSYEEALQGALTIYHFSGANILLFVGILTSFILFFGEHLSKLKCK